MPSKSQARSAPGIEVFVENLPGNVYRRVRRPDGTYYFEYLSSGLFRQFDIDPEPLLREGTIRFDWIHPDDRDRFVADLEVSAATLGMLDHRVRVVGADGRVHWARGIGRPSRRADGSVVWDGIVIEVTREVEAEAALYVAKAEADRAHAAAAALVGAAARALAAPIEDLARAIARLESLGIDVGDLARTSAALTGARERLTDANAEAAPARPSRAAMLTDRQREVAHLVSTGMTNKQIAQKLGITPGTAKLHVAAVLRATGVGRRRDLARQRV